MQSIAIRTHCHHYEDNRRTSLAGLLDVRSPAALSLPSRFSFVPLRLTHLFCLLLLSAIPSLAQGPVGASQGWQLLKEHRFVEAAEHFQRASSAGPDFAELGQALALLNAQPRTQKRIEQARRLLETIANRTDDREVAALSDYLLARIGHSYAGTGLPEAAADGYRTVSQRHADTVFGAYATVRLILLDLYQAATDWPQRLAAAEERLQTLSQPEAKRNAHLAIGQACLFFRTDDAVALRHLLAAHALGLQGTIVRANTTLAIAALAERLDENATALHFWRQFLAENSRDDRRGLAAERVQALEAGGAR